MKAGSSADKVGAAIRETAEELRPWVEARIDEWPPDRSGRIAPNDPACLISVVLDRWRSDFAEEFGPQGLTLIQEFRHTRNRWAHHQEFDRLDAFRAVDTCRLVLRAIGSPHEHSLIREAHELLRADSGEAPKPVQRASGQLARDGGGHRRSRSPEFRGAQWERRFARHIAPVNRLVDDLIAEHDGRWMPYVAPYHGGIDASVLMLFQDPGKMTSAEFGGSGFIGCENDDPSAGLLAQCLDEADVPQGSIIPWNSYPWFLPDQKGVNPGRREEGIEPLHRLLRLLPSVHTVVTCGAVAHDTWHRFQRRHPDSTEAYRHLETFHTSGQGIVNGGQQTKAEGVAHVVATLRAAFNFERRSQQGEDS